MNRIKEGMVPREKNELVPTGQTEGPEIPEHKVVLSSARDELVSLVYKVLAKCGSVGLDLLGIDLEARCAGLFQGNSKCRNGVVVGPSLERGEHCEVDFILEIVNCTLGLTLLWWLWALPVENHPGSWAPEALVGGGRYYITVFKWICSFLKQQKLTVQS